MATNYNANFYSNTSYNGAFDYSAHLNLLNDLLERVAIALETIATQTTAIAVDVDTIATHQTTMAAKQTTMADKQTTMADKQTLMASHLDRMQSVVDDVSRTDSADQGRYSRFSPGPHARVIATSWEDDAERSIRSIINRNLTE